MGRPLRAGHILSGLGCNATLEDIMVRGTIAEGPLLWCSQWIRELSPRGALG